jgi:hypothetical protein
VTLRKIQSSCDGSVSLGKELLKFRESLLAPSSGDFCLHLQSASSFSAVDASWLPEDMNLEIIFGASKIKFLEGNGANWYESYRQFYS